MKLELAYKDMSVEQARQHYHEVTTSEVTAKSEDGEEKPVVKKAIRRKRILAKENNR